MDHVITVEEIPNLTTSVATQKKNLLPWKILCLVLVLLVTLGWVGIIALLILKEEWQLVMVAWLLLYAAAHFCYWYCRRHSSRVPGTTFRQRFMARLRGTEGPTTIVGDEPPSYEDLVKTELPPPAYKSVVGGDTPKMQRFLNIQSLALPWFIKKKSLEQSASDSVTPATPTTGVVTVAVTDKDGMSFAPVDAEGLASTSYALGQVDTSSSNGIWRSSDVSNTFECDVPSLALDDDERTGQNHIELPSYETLMRDAVQPVLTPIHQALAGLPRPPPPYSPRPMDTITEQNEQSQQRQQNE